MKIPAEYFDTFFDPLVGSDEAVADFRGDLIEHVNAISLDSKEEVDQLYNALRSRADKIVEETVNSELEDKPNPDSFRERRRRHSITVNGKSGVQFTVDAMQSLGNIYEEFAAVPQHEERVIGNAHRLLGNVLGIAFDDRIIGAINLEAYRQGLNPRNILNSPALFIGIATNWKMRTSFDKAYDVTVTDDGQLSIQPKFRKLGKIFDRQCPATQTRTTVGEKNTLALSTFMRTVGGVAIDQIFPRQFDIIKT